MQEQTYTSRLDQIRAQIATLDLEPIKMKISSKEEGYGWTPEHVREIELAYRRFLMLHAMYPDRQIAPTRDIDAFWHAHILDTRKYATDCQAIFGEFIHHYPYLGLMGDEDKLADAADTLAVLFTLEFGAEMPNNASRKAEAAWCGVELKGDKSAAWCGVELKGDKSAAWCGVEKKADKSAAWCGVELKADRSAAWCGVEVAPRAEAMLETQD